MIQRQFFIATTPQLQVQDTNNTKPFLCWISANTTNTDTIAPNDTVAQRMASGLRLSAHTRHSATTTNTDTIAPNDTVAQRMASGLRLSAHNTSYLVLFLVLFSRILRATVGSERSSCRCGCWLRNALMLTTVGCTPSAAIRSVIASSLGDHVRRWWVGATLSSASRARM